MRLYLPFRRATQTRSEAATQLYATLLSSILSLKFSYILFVDMFHFLF